MAASGPFSKRESVPPAGVLAGAAFFAPGRRDVDDGLSVPAGAVVVTGAGLAWVFSDEVMVAAWARGPWTELRFGSRRGRTGERGRHRDVPGGRGHDRGRVGGCRVELREFVQQPGVGIALWRAPCCARPSRSGKSSTAVPALRSR